MIVLSYDLPFYLLYGKISLRGDFGSKFCVFMMADQESISTEASETEQDLQILMKEKNLWQDLAFEKVLESDRLYDLSISLKARIYQMKKCELKLKRKIRYLRKKMKKEKAKETKQDSVKQNSSSFPCL